MITPQFEVRQDDAFIYVDIRAPFIKASHIQFEVSENVFVFSLPPYYLRLRFSGNVQEDEFMTSSYDLKNSLVHCKVSKQNKGEHFEDLDMLSKLLATKRQETSSQNKPLIQELNADSDELSKKMAEPDFDWEVEQTVPEKLGNNDVSNVEGHVKYGFNNQYSERVQLSLFTGNEINELEEPEKETSALKQQLIRDNTKAEFDPDHYLADLHDDDMIKDIMKFDFQMEPSLNGDQKDRIMKLGHREFFLENQKSIYLGVIPLVFSWAYDFRTNYGDTSVESSWTIGKLSPSMAFLFNSYTTVKDVVIDCTARALTKPLYRNWELTMLVWKDTLNILQKGKSAVLIVFAHLLEIFENEIHSVYRQILVEDYAIWIQYASDKVIKGMYSELEKACGKLTKEDIFLPLVEIENIMEPENGEPDSDDESDDN